MKNLLLPTSVGIGLRREIAGDLLARPESVDFLEVVAEGCFEGEKGHREAIALSRVWPVVPHGVKLSLGSAEGVDMEHAARLGKLTRDLGAPYVTEHVAFVRAGGREIGHLTQLPRTRESLRVLARNVDRARHVLPDVPLLLENAAWTLRWPDDDLDEASFYCEVVRATGCDMLLDLANLYANALNAGENPSRVLAGYPLDRVKMVHVAGGFRRDGFYVDSHAHPVPDPVFALLGELVAAIGPLPVMIERDSAFPPFEELAAEVAHARQALANPRTTKARPAPTPRATVTAAHRPSLQTLADTQADLAALLTDVVPRPPPLSLSRFDVVEIERTREVLRRKRVEDALMHLPRLAHSPDQEALRELAFVCIAASPRALRFTAVCDAMRIASAAIGHAGLASLARLDELLLRSRFLGSPETGTVRPRVAPFLGRALGADGGAVWAVKSPGARSAVRMFAREEPTGR